MTDLRELAKKHWDYTAGVMVQTNLFPDTPESLAIRVKVMSLCEYLYIESFIHGYKHGKELK